VRDIVNSSTRSIAVVRAQLPYVDRRALSQAWFSALGLAEPQTRFTARPGAAPQPARGTSQFRPAPPGARATAASVAAPATHPATAVARAPRASDGAAQLDLARLRKTSAAVIAPGTVEARALRYPPVHASFRLEVDGGRVRVILRRENGVLHVIALCSRKHVALVRRALARAGAHLRERGDALRGEVRALPGPEDAA
jgi:hypothetical protein